jgi:hypothetical protein
MKYATFILLATVIAVVSTMAGGELPTGKTMGKESKATGGAPVVSSPAGTMLTDIFVEGFNDTSATGFPPPGWIMINQDGNVDPTDTAWYSSLTTGGTGSLGPYEGLAFAADYYGTANGFYIDDYLITPNTGGSPPPGTVDSLTFWLTSRLSSSGDYPDSLDIRVSTTGRNANDFTVRLGYVLAPKANWTRFAYSLPIAANRYIAFRYLMYDGGPSGSNSDKVCLDDVRISRYSSTAVRESGQLPTRFALGQNYPNPFNPSTRITFELSNAGLAVLKVFNILGEEITTLVNEQLSPGTYTATFSAENLPTGVYIYRLTSGTYSSTKRMLLTK